MKIYEVYPAKNLKASDLNEEVDVTVSGYEVVEFDDGRQIVLTFEGSQKTFVCNKTNSATIGSQLGNDIDSWIGKTITLMPSQTTWGNNTVACIRVKLKPVASATDEVQQLPGTPRRPPTDGFTESPF